MNVTTIPVCPVCHGSGQLNNDKPGVGTDTCPRCNGTGYPPEQQHQMSGRSE